MKKIFLLLSLIIVFISCEKEETTTPVELKNEKTENVSVKILNKNQIVGNKRILKELNQFNVHNSKINNKEVDNDGYQFTINTSKVKYIEKGDYHSYTFPIERQAGNGNAENLLLSRNSQGKYDVFLVRYGFKKSELQNMDIEKITNTSITYIPIKFDYSSIIDSTNKANAVLICIEYWEYTPDQGELVGAGNDELEGWYLVSTDCTYVYGGGGGDSGDGGGSSTPGTGTSGGGDGGGDTSCTGLKANAPCVGEDDEIITGPVFIPYTEAELKENFDTRFPIINSFLYRDYTTETLRLTSYLKSFGDPEDEIFALYIENLVPNFQNMTLGEVDDIYNMTRSQARKVSVKYLIAVVYPFAEAALPFIQYAVIEASIGAAIPLLRSIPISMVTRGTRLNKLVLEASKIGQSGIKPFAREIPSSSVSKAEELFKALTKDRIGIYSHPNNYTKVADMGSNNAIIFHTEAGPLSPNVIATIELKFPGLFDDIIKLKFYN